MNLVLLHFKRLLLPLLSLFVVSPSCDALDRRDHRPFRNGVRAGARAPVLHTALDLRQRHVRPLVLSRLDNTRFRTLSRPAASRHAAWHMPEAGAAGETSRGAGRGAGGAALAAAAAPALIERAPSELRCARPELRRCAAAAAAARPRPRAPPPLRALAPPRCPAAPNTAARQLRTDAS